MLPVLLTLLLLAMAAAEMAHVRLGNPSADIISWSDGAIAPEDARRALQSSFADLNNLLNGVTFGANPGPCPNAANKCFTRFSDLPESVRASPTNINGKTRRLDQWVRAGDFWVWQLTCSNLQVDFITLSRTSEWIGAAPPAGRRSVAGRIQVNDLKLDCDAKTEFKDLDMEAYYEICVPIPFSSPACTGFYPDIAADGSADVRLRKSEMSGNEAGLSLDARFDIFQPSSANPPDDMTFRTCAIDISNGFRLNNLNLDFDGLLSLLEWIIEPLVEGLFRSAVEAILEGIFCGVFTSLAYSEGNVRGPITDFFYNTSENILDWRALPLRERSDFEADEIALPPYFNNAGPSSSWLDFSQSGLVEAFSVALNDFLGTDGDTPGRLAVNDIVDSYNGDTSGVIDFPDIEDTFQLSVLPTFEFGEDLTRNTLVLRGVRIGGLNTFTNWQVLDNGFSSVGFGDPYKYQLISDVSMTRFELRLTWELTMTTGNWVTGGSIDESFTLVTESNFDDLSVSAATLTLIQLENLLDLQVGQILRESVEEEEFLDIFACLMLALDHLHLSGLTASASNVELTVSELFSFEQLVDQVVSFADYIYSQTIQNDLPKIMENFFRLEANAYLNDTYFDAPPEECPAYVPVSVPVGNPDRYFNLTENLGRQAISAFINEVIGGKPVKRSSVDVNALLNATLDFAVYREPGGINADPDSLYQVRYNRPGEWQLLWGVDELASLGDQGTFRLELPGPRTSALDSIWELEFLSSPSDDYALDFDFTWGNGSLIPLDGDTPVPVPPLGFELPVAITTDAGGTAWADEDFTLRLQLQLRFTGSVQLLVNKDEMYQTTARNLQTLACILATLEEKELRTFDVDLLGFELSIVFVDDGQSGFSLLPLGAALEAWRLKLQEDTTKETVEYFLNFVIDRLQNETIKIFNTDFDPPYTRTGCLAEASPLEGTLFDEPLPLPNFTYFAEVIREATTPQETPLGDGTPADYEDPFVWESAIVGLGEGVFDLNRDDNAFISALATAITPESAQKALFILSETDPDPESPSILDPLYRILVLEPDNSTTLRVDPNNFVNVDFTPDTEGLLPGLQVRVKEIEVTNLNSFQSLQAFLQYVSEKDGFLAPARFTTLNKLGYGNSTMTLRLEMEVQVEEIVFTAATTPGTLLVDTITVEVNLTGLDVTALLAIAVSDEAFDAAKLGEVIFFNETTHAFEVRADAFNCTLRNLVYDDGIFFPMLQANVTSVDGPFITVTENIFGAEGKAVIEVLVQIFVELFRTQLPNLSQGPLRSETNLYLQNVLRNATSAAQNCTGIIYPTFESTNGVGTFNFTRSEFGPDLQALIDVDLLNPNSAANINQLIDGFIGDVDFFFDSVLTDTALLYNGRDYGIGNLSFGGFRIEGLGSGGPSDARVVAMTILDNTPFGVEQPFTTRSTFETTGTFELSARIFYTFDELFVGPDENAGALGLGSDDDRRRSLQSSGGGYRVANDFRIGVELTGLSVSTNLTSRVEINRVLELSAGDLRNSFNDVNKVSCFFSIFEERGLQVEDFALQADVVRLTLRCEDECTSPMFAEINNVGGVVTDTVTSDALTESFNGIFGLITALAGQTKAQDFLDAVIFDARAECKGLSLDLEADTSAPLTDAASVMGFLGAGVFAGALAGVFFLIPTHRRRRDQVMAVAFARLNGKDGQIALKGEHLLLIERKLKSAFRHPAIPRASRFVVPGLILVAIGLFLAANLGTVGATVQVTIAAAGDVTQPIAILDFTLATSINDMWNSGSYLLALLIFVASAAWPHIKSLLLLFCWFAPPTILNTGRRGSLLETLDALGKWSLIDAYVLVMLQVAFRFYLTSSYVPQLDFLFPDAFVVDVVVIPGPSIFLFVVATMLALVVNHWMIAKHRQALASDQALEDRVNGVERPQLPNTKRAIMRHVFLVPDDRNLLYGFSSGAKLSAGALIAFSSIMVAVGSFLPLITFTFGGVGGTVLGFIREDLQSRTYSAVSIAIAIRDGIPASETATQAGVVFLQMVYLVFTLFTPILLLILLSVLWFRPLTTGDQKRLLFVAEIVAAWEALFVLLVAILVAAAEVGQLAQFVVQAATGDVCVAIVQPLLLVGVDEEDAVCFDVSAVVEPSGYMLLFGSVLTVVTAFIMFRFLKPAIYDRHLQRMGRLDRDGQCPKNVKGNWPNELVLRNAVRPVSRIRPGPGPGQGGQVAPASFENDEGFVEATDESRSAFNPAFRPDIDV